MKTQSEHSLKESSNTTNAFETYSAIIYKAGNSDAHQVNVTITSTHITFLLNDERINYILSDARLEPYYNNVPREVELVGGYKLIFEADVSIEHHFISSQSKLFITIKNNKKLFLLALILVVILFILIINDSQSVDNKRVLSKSTPLIEHGVNQQRLPSGSENENTLK